jgi:hypothetical protein
MKATDLRKNARYFISDPECLRFSRMIPLTYRYYGKRLYKETNEMLHLFAASQQTDVAVYLTDREVRLYAERFSVRREREVNAAADHYNRTGRVPQRRTLKEDGNESETD